MSESGAVRGGFRMTLEGASFGVLSAHASALVAAAVELPVLAGFLLASSVLRIRRSRPGGFRLHVEQSDGWPGLLLDVGLAALVAVWLASASTGNRTLGPTAWSLQVIPWLVALSALLTHYTHARRGPFDATRGTARLLLAVGLVLTPVATLLSPIAPHHWVLTALAASGVVRFLELARRVLIHLDSTGVVRENRLVLMGKGSALRNAIAALVATSLDFSVFSLLVRMSVCTPPTATFVGAAAGGLLNFLVNKSWTFDASGRGRTMARRYLTVSAASAALNASLVLVLLWVPNQHVTVVWLVARGLVFLGWNYPLQRDYVFAHRGRPQLYSEP